MDLIKTEMTPKARLMGYAMGKEVDRIPIILIFGDTSPPLYGYKIRDYYASADMMVEIETNLARDYGSDSMGIGVGLRGIAEALGTKLKYPEDRISYVHEPVITDLKQVGSMDLVDVEKDGNLSVVMSANARLQEKFGDTHFIGCGIAGPVTTATALYGVTPFLKDSIKNPEGIHTLLRYSTDNIIKCIRDMCKKIPTGFSIAEPVITTDVMSPKLFAAFAEPYIKEVISAITETIGQKPSIHFCGHTKGRWPFIKEWPVSSFSVDNCESLLELKNECGQRFTIAGNVSPVDTLLGGTPGEVEEAVKKCLLDGADSPRGFILATGCQISVGTPKDNITAMANAAAIYGKGAKVGQHPIGMRDYM